MKKSNLLLTATASLFLMTSIASAENVGQNDRSSVTCCLADEWTARSEEKTSKKEPATNQKVAAATDFDASIAQSNADYCCIANEWNAE